MQTFPPPNHRLMLSGMSLDNVLKNDNFFSSFPVHSIHLLIPGEETLIKNFTEKLMPTDNIYFIVKDVIFSSLIQSSFITHFVKAGLIWAFSNNVSAEEENFISIIPSGKLILSLESNISACLSLEKEYPHGQKKHIKRKRPQKSIYKIDLISPDFVPGKKLYKSVTTELNKLNHIKFELLVKWEPEGDVCYQSIRTYFENCGHECLTCEPNYTHYPKFGIPIPKVNFEQFNMEEAEDLLEWVGTQVCDINLCEDVDSFVSNFKINEPSEILQRLQIGLWEGFYTGAQIHNLINEARNLFKSHPKVPFVVFTISGYQDCYISCKGSEKFSSADKLINIVIPKTLNCWITTLNIT